MIMIHKRLRHIGNISTLLHNFNTRKHVIGFIFFSTKKTFMCSNSLRQTKQRKIGDWKFIESIVGSFKNWMVNFIVVSWIRCSAIDKPSEWVSKKKPQVLIKPTRIWGSGCLRQESYHIFSLLKWKSHVFQPLIANQDIVSISVEAEVSPSYSGGISFTNLLENGRVTQNTSPILFRNTSCLVC